MMRYFIHLENVPSLVFVCAEYRKKLKLHTKLHCVSKKHLKNAPTLASCSFDMHGLILTTFGKQHQHAFKNVMHLQFSLSLHFYLLYLLLNSCDGNYAFWRSSILVKQSSSFSRKHRTLSLQICVHQTVRLTTDFVEWCRNVYTLYKHPSVTRAWPATWSSTSLTHGQAYHKTSSTKQLLVNAESGYVQTWGKKT